VVAPETGLTGNKNNKIFKNWKMAIEIRGQQHFSFLLAVHYCFAMHIMFSSFAFEKQDIRQPADRPMPAGGAEMQTCLPVTLAQINLPLVQTKN
jgi:hypothetical protein